jgi:hypothetical protein
MDRAAEHGVEPILELLANRLGDEGHVEGNTRRDRSLKLRNQKRAAQGGGPHSQRLV